MPNIKRNAQQKEAQQYRRNDERFICTVVAPVDAYRNRCLVGWRDIAQFDNSIGFQFFF